MLLAIHTIYCPLDPKEIIVREDCLSLAKLEEEGTEAEEIFILGWTINTNLLTISLPTKKFRLWRRDLKLILQSKKFLTKD
jgi:hypothetical protein